MACVGLAFAVCACVGGRPVRGMGDGGPMQPHLELEGGASSKCVFAPTIALVLRFGCGISTWPWPAFRRDLVLFGPRLFEGREFHLLVLA